MRIVFWPVVVQALVNPTIRPDLLVLCRAVSQIVGGITSVSVGESVVDLTSSICMVAGLRTIRSRCRCGDLRLLQCTETIGFLVVLHSVSSGRLAPPTQGSTLHAVADAFELSTRLSHRAQRHL